MFKTVIYTKAKPDSKLNQRTTTNEVSNSTYINEYIHALLQSEFDYETTLKIVDITTEEV